MNKNKEIFKIAILAALASLINLSIGNGSDQRVSLGIVVMIIMLHRDFSIPIIKTSIVTGVFVFLTRLIVFSTGGLLSTDIVLSYAIDIIFYLAYAFAYQLLVRKTESFYKSPLILLLILSDFFANTVEYFVRFYIYSREISHQSFWFLFVAALLRSFIIVVVYESIKDTSIETEDANTGLQIRLSQNIVSSLSRLMEDSSIEKNTKLVKEVEELKKDAEVLLKSFKG